MPLQGTVVDPETASFETVPQGLQILDDVMRRVYEEACDDGVEERSERTRAVKSQEVAVLWKQEKLREYI